MVVSWNRLLPYFNHSWNSWIFPHEPTIELDIGYTQFSGTPNSRVGIDVPTFEDLFHITFQQPYICWRWNIPFLVGWCDCHNGTSITPDTQLLGISITSPNYKGDTNYWEPITSIPSPGPISTRDLRCETHRLRTSPSPPAVHLHQLIASQAKRNWAFHQERYLYRGWYRFITF